MLVFLLCPTEHNLLMRNLHTLERDQIFTSPFTKAFVVATVQDSGTGVDELSPDKQKSLAAVFLRHFIHEFSKLEIGKIPRSLLKTATIAPEHFDPDQPCRISMSILLHDQLNELLVKLFNGIRQLYLAAQVTLYKEPTLVFGHETHPQDDGVRAAWKQYICGGVHGGHWSIACFMKTTTSTEQLFKVPFEDLWLANLSTALRAVS